MWTANRFPSISTLKIPCSKGWNALHAALTVKNGSKPCYHVICLQRSQHYCVEPYIGAALYSPNQDSPYSILPLPRRRAHCKSPSQLECSAFNWQAVYDSRCLSEWLYCSWAISVFAFSLSELAEVINVKSYCSLGPGAQPATTWSPQPMMCGTSTCTLSLPTRCHK